MELLLIYLVMGGMMVYALYLIFRGRNSGIVDPTLGFLIVGENDLAALFEEDRAALGPLFAKIESGAGYQIPKCDVLFMYADIKADGSFGPRRRYDVPPCSGTSGRNHCGRRLEQLSREHQHCGKNARTKAGQPRMDLRPQRDRVRKFLQRTVCTDEKRQTHAASMGGYFSST